MNTTYRTQGLIIGCFAMLVAVSGETDEFARLATGNPPAALQNSGGAYIDLGDGDWVYLLHGGLPAVLNAKPVSGVWLLEGADWTEVDTNAPAVYGHSIVSVGSGRANGFGGSDINDELKSLGVVLSYRIERRDGGFEVEIEEIEVPGANPGSCSQSPVVRLEETDSMLLVGGMCSYYPGRSSEVWEYSVSGNSWLRRADLPRALSDHTAVVADGQVWVFGGRGDGGLLNEVYRYDPQLDSWSEVSTTGARPEPVADHRAVAVASSMIVFGGIREAFWPETIAEVWELDVATRGWHRKSDLPFGLAEMTAGLVPPGKGDGAAFQVLVHGGVIDAWSFPQVLSDETWIYTSDIEPAQESIAVPSVARVKGRGAYFSSILHLMNISDRDREIELTFTPRLDMGGATVTVSRTVLPGVMDIIEDPLAELFGIRAGHNAVGSLLITGDPGFADDLMVQSFVSAKNPSGEEYGTYFPAIRSYDAMREDEVGYLMTTEDPSTYRVNVGVMAIEDATTVTVAPALRMGDPIAQPVVLSLDAGENSQIDDIHRHFGIGTVTDVIVEVSVTSGRAVAYATVLDGTGSYSGTSDPTTLHPVIRGAERVTILEIGSIRGIDEFAGSAMLANHSDFEAEVTAHFCERGRPGVMDSRTIIVAAGEAIGFANFVGEVFDIHDTVGSVVLESANAARISASGREFAILRDRQSRQIIGTAGTYLPGLSSADLVTPGSIWHVMGLRQQMQGGEKERSHLAIFNPGSETARVNVTLVDGGDGAVEGARSWIVEGGELIQIDNVMKKMNPDVDGREKRIEISVDSPVYLHAFRVNTWGDSMTLRAGCR